MAIKKKSGAAFRRKATERRGAGKEMIHQRIVKEGKKLAQDRYERHYHPKNPHHKKHIVADLVLSGLVVLLVIFSLYLVIFYQQAIIREKISLVIVPASLEVKSGGRLDFVVEIKNNTGKSLTNSNLVLPEGTNYVLTATKPSFYDDNQVWLGTLDNGESAQIEVTGYTLLDINHAFRLNAILQYEGALATTQQKLASEAVRVSGSELIASVDLPEAIIANQPFSYTLNYQNLSEVTSFEEVTVIPAWPPGWKVIESSLEPDELTGALSLGTVGSLEKGSVTGVAQLETIDLEEARISLRLFSAPFGRPLWQGEILQTVPVSYPNVNGEVTANVNVVAPGGSVLYTVKVENEEDFPLRDVVAIFTVNPAIFASHALTEPLNSDGNLEVPLISALGPGVGAEVNQAFSIRAQINPELAFALGKVLVAMPVEIRYLAENDQKVVIPLKPLSLGIQSDLSLQAFARYFSVEGDQIGRGPLPPEVGETTKYWVFIQLNNQLHEVKGIVVNAILAEGVKWTGRSSVTAGRALQFNEGSQLVTWSLEKMPDYKTDYGEERFGVAFEVAITPTTEQFGEIIDLVRDIEVQGRDTVTGGILTARIVGINNELSRDSFAIEGGKVEL